MYQRSMVYDIWRTFALDSQNSNILVSLSLAEAYINMQATRSEDAQGAKSHARAELHAVARSREAIAS